MIMIEVFFYSFLLFIVFLSSLYVLTSVSSVTYFIKSILGIPLPSLPCSFSSFIVVTRGLSLISCPRFTILS